MPEGSIDARAAIGVRLVALFIDGVILLLVERFFVWLSKPIGLVVAFVVALAYLVYFEGSSAGQTPGKRAMSIRVVDAGTFAPIGPGQAALRFGGRLVSMAAIFIGYLWAIWDPENQTWHDKIAGTYVVPTDAYPVDAWPGTFGR